MRPITPWIACVALLCAFAQAWAAPGTSSLTATASVNTNCSVTTSAVAFNTYDPIVANVSTALNATGAVTVACVKGTAPTIAFGLGSYATGSTRRMSNGTAFLIYELYQPPSTTPGTACSFPGTTVWGTGVNALSATAAPDKNPRTYYVCGTVAAGQNPSVGTYTDTVVATVTF